MTALAYLPALRNGFVDLDDQENLVVNPWIRGFGGPELRWMATAFHVGHWQPFTWLSFALDYRLWGLDPAGFHLTSLVLHAANAALLFMLAIRLLAAAGVAPERCQAGAIVAALAWSLHPLRVESVAWATARRDVLSSFFLLSALLGYVPGDGRAPRLGRALVLTALSLASKASGMVIPALLLALDVWPLRRVSRASAGRVALEKLAFLALAVPSAMVALSASRAAGALQSLAAVTPAHRIGAAMYGIGFYVWKTIVPLRLLPLYEFPPDMGPLYPAALAGFATTLAIVGAAIWQRRRCPGLAAAAAWYLVAIAPTLGLAQSGPQVAADRYTYVAAMGWSVLGGGLLAARPLALAPVLLALAVLTWIQTGTWHDATTLWTRTVAIEPRHAYGHKSLGDAARIARDADGAIAQYREALRLRPAFDEAHNNLASLLASRGQYDEAFLHYQQALRINPRYAFAFTSYGVALANAGRAADAVEQHRHALAIDPELMEAHVNLGSALDDLGRLDEAMQEYEAAIRLRPSPEAYNDMGALLMKLSRVSEAVTMFRRAVALRPDLGTVRENLGLALLAAGDRAGAAAELTAALRLDPSLARSRETLAGLRAP